MIARYATKGSYTVENGYVILTPEELEDCAEAVFADFKDLPGLPTGSTLVIHQEADETTEEQYLLKKTSSSVELLSAEYDRDSRTLTVEVRDGSETVAYQIVLSGSAIKSITKE